MAKLWLECGSTTTQQARNKVNGDIKDVKTCRIFAINIWKRGSIRGEMAKLGLEWNYNNNTASTKTGTKQQGRKIRGPSWNVCSNGHDTGVMNWYNAGLRVISKTSGLPIVGDSKTIHVSKSRPFWNKCFILSMVWYTVIHSKDDIWGRHVQISIKILQYNE